MGSDPDDDATRRRRVAALTRRYEQILYVRHAMQYAGIFAVFLTVISAPLSVAVAVAACYAIGLVAAWQEREITRRNYMAMAARPADRAAMIANVRRDLEHGPPFAAGTEWFSWNVRSWLWWGSQISDLTYSVAVGYSVYALDWPTEAAAIAAAVYITVLCALVGWRETTHIHQKQLVLKGLLSRKD